MSSHFSLQPWRLDGEVRQFASENDISKVYRVNNDGSTIYYFLSDEDHINAQARIFPFKERISDFLENSTLFFHVNESSAFAYRLKKETRVYDGNYKPKRPTTF